MSHFYALYVPIQGLSGQVQDMSQFSIFDVQTEFVHECTATFHLIIASQEAYRIEYTVGFLLILETVILYLLEFQPIVCDQGYGERAEKSLIKLINTFVFVAIHTPKFHSPVNLT